MADLMTHVAKKTPAKWYEVGIQLNIGIANLQAFEQQTRDQMRLFSNVFIQWKKDNKIPFAWDTIITALENVGENDTVKDLREWLYTCTSSSTTQATLPGESFAPQN